NSISGKNINTVQNFNTFIGQLNNHKEVISVLQSIEASNPELFKEIKNKYPDVNFKKLTDTSSHASSKYLESFYNKIVKKANSSGTQTVSRPSGFNGIFALFTNSLLNTKQATAAQNCENLTPTQKSKAIKVLKSVAKSLTKILDGLSKLFSFIAKLGTKLEDAPFIGDIAKLVGICSAIAAGAFHLLSGLIKIVLSDDDSSLHEKFDQAFKVLQESLTDILVQFGVEQEDLEEFKGKLAKAKEMLTNAKEDLDGVLSFMKEEFQKIIEKRSPTEEAVPV
ncbi:MAG: hypothetical protein LBI77_02675, partial [Puniceicoccales bacterium]|nr:hypothetical protein [Puniceicoccales bacterium]